MRIFLTLSASSNNSVPNSKTWLRNLYEPLVDLGHQVFLFRIDLYSEEIKISRNSINFKNHFSKKLLDIFKNENKKKQFDYFISYLENDDINTSVIEEIKKMGVKTLNFSCNNIHQFYLVDKISPFFDFNLHSEKYAADKFISIGAKPIWFQMAANPKYYYPIDIEKSIDVSFVGARYAKRLNYIYQLLENEINVQVYGPGWKSLLEENIFRILKNEIKRTLKIGKSIFTFFPKERSKLTSDISTSDFYDFVYDKYYQNFHYPLNDQEMIKMYSMSKINLGFLEVYNNHDHSSFTLQHLHLREFEVPMSGGLYITNYSDELAEHYEPDKEVLVYRNEYELIDKVKYYLSHPVEAEKIRTAGFHRALRSHTYQKRYIDLFNGLNNG